MGGRWVPPAVQKTGEWEVPMAPKRPGSPGDDTAAIPVVDGGSFDLSEEKSTAGKSREIPVIFGKGMRRRRPDKR